MRPQAHGAVGVGDQVEGLGRADRGGVRDQRGGAVRRVDVVAVGVGLQADHGLRWSERRGVVGVAGRDDVGLHRVLGGVGREAGRDGALEELPVPAVLLSPPVPSSMEVCTFIGLVAVGQRARIGLWSARLTARCRTCRVKLVVPLFFSQAETNVPFSLGYAGGLGPVLLKYMPFSRSAADPGTGAGAAAGPAGGAVVDRVHRGVAVVGVVGLALPKSKQHWLLVRLEDVTMYTPSGCEPVGTFLALLIAVAGAEVVELDPVGRLAADRHRQRHRVGADVRRRWAGPAFLPSSPSRKCPARSACCCRWRSGRTAR